VAIKALGAWRHVSSARRSGSVFCLAVKEQRQAIIRRRACELFVLDVRDLYYFGDTLKVGLLDLPCFVTRNVSLELWLGIGVKHVAFLELWLGMASLEFWLEIANEHDEL